MGLLDEILKQAGGAGARQSGGLGAIAEIVMKNPQIVAAAISMLNPKDASVGGGGGLADVISAFNKGGLGRHHVVLGRRRPQQAGGPGGPRERPRPRRPRPVRPEGRGSARPTRRRCWPRCCPSSSTSMTPQGQVPQGNALDGVAGLAPRPARRPLAARARGGPGGRAVPRAAPGSARIDGMSEKPAAPRARLQEVGRPRVPRVDRRRGHPGALHPHLRRPGLQDPHGLDGAEPADRRPPARQQAGLLARLSARSEDALFGKRPIQRGHVVVFKFPEDPTRDFIKRVIGLPGETVEIRDKQVFVDGQAHRRARTRTSSSRRCARTTRSTASDDVDPRQLGAAGGARRAAARAGRQPGQQPRQPLLGLPARSTRSRGGRCSSTGRTRRPGRSTTGRASSSG